MSVFFSDKCLVSLRQTDVLSIHKRYTDLLNADNDVRALLTDYIKLMKKVYRQANPCETRILWLVNCVKLHNLLEQYGGIPDYIKLNTEQQNKQQLKNFDLSEYR